MWYVVSSNYISTSPKWKLRNNIDIIAYFAGGNETYEYLSRPKSIAVKDIDVADILDHKYRCRIDIGKWTINPPLLRRL